jgi:uncharacterized membrane protein
MKGRLVFIDLLRGWATIVMIEVHVFNAFLIPSLKETGWFNIVDYVNGWVAPSFLFVAGFVFVVASERKLEDFRTFGPAFWRQIGRITLIWIVGYALHLPFFSFTRTVHETTEAGWLQFYQSDILHCIAIGLLIVFLGRILIRSDERYQKFLVIAGGVLVLAAPFLWDIDFGRSLPASVAAYLNGQHSSLFPIFPWIGFVIFGAVTAIGYKKAKASDKELDYLKLVGLVSVVLIAAGLLLSELPVRIPWASNAVRANPLFFATRLGIVLLLMLLCWYYAARRKTEKSFVLDVGRESLVVYTAHLLVIYGQYWNEKSLAYWHGGTLSVAQCIVATLALMVLMVAGAKVWGSTKRRSLPTARVLSYGTGLIVLLVFFLKTS